MSHSSEGVGTKKAYHSPTFQFHGRFGELTQVPPGKPPADIPDNPFYPVCDVSPT